MGPGIKVSFSGFRVQDLGFRVQGLGLWGLVFGSGFWFLV
jgi:hypothetical protein